MLALAGCAAADIPEIYHGHAGKSVLAVPSRIASSVLYDGESDWTAPEKPKAQRTDRDPIRLIEFYVDLDHPDSIITDQAARDRLLARSGTVNVPAVVGHVVGITVDLPAEAQPSVAAIRSQFSKGHLFPAPAFQALKPAPPEFGLETRRADWSKPVKDRERHGGGIFNVDVDYLSVADDIWLYCNDTRQVVAPFAPMASCQFVIVVPEMGGRISGRIDRGDVPRWRDLRAAALATLRSFVVSPSH
ncbi:hypothetical protein MOP88_03410 [Sphingomonas sp. WKB10]|nr:hypothetical protein [Sphingomonas sp. WKB10]